MSHSFIPPATQLTEEQIQDRHAAIALEKEEQEMLTMLDVPEEERNDNAVKACQRVLQYLNYTEGGEVQGAGAATVKICVDILKEIVEQQTGTRQVAVAVEDLPF
jgi:predicted TIM-barrel enzyme